MVGKNPLHVERKICSPKVVYHTLSLLRFFGLLFLLLAFTIPQSYASEAAVPPIKYMIIVTGGELLSGIYPDGHTYFLTRTLHPLGLQCAGSMCVDDKQADLKEALRFATSKAPLVIVTGGLGPTDNDITREVLSGFTAIPLKEDPEALKEMARRFRTSPAKLRSNLRRQIQVPIRGAYFKNSNGTAIGLAFELQDSVIVALPGPPRELQAMVRNELVPYLSRRFGTRLPGCSLTLRFVGLGQSQIDQTLEDHVPLPTDVTVSSQFQGGRVDFTFSLPDDTPKDRTRLQELKQQIAKHLGDNMYADDDTSLEAHVIELLNKHGVTLALVEVGSGGSLAAALSSADGAKHVLVGAYVAPTEDKMRHLLGVSENNWVNVVSPNQRIERLAAAAAETTASRWIVVVGEVRPDDGNTGSLTVVFRQPGGYCESRRIRVRGTGEMARARLSTQLLDELRRKIK